MSFDDLLLRPHLPHVLRAIFLDCLDYPDLEACLRASPAWRRQILRQVPRNRLASKALAHAWTGADLCFRELRLGDDDGEVVSFVDSRPDDVLVVLTKHGQKKCRVLQLDPAGGLGVARSVSLVFPSALTRVQASSDLAVFQLSAHPAVVLDRRDGLAERKVHIGKAAKRLTVAGDSLLLNVLRKPVPCPDLVVTKLDPANGFSGSSRLTPACVVRRRPCGTDDRDGCPRFQHAFFDGGARAAVACVHGDVTVQDVGGAGSTRWTTNFLGVSPASRLPEIYLPSVFSPAAKDNNTRLTTNATYLAVYYCSDCGGEVDNGDAGANAHAVHLLDAVGGSLVKKFEYRSAHRPVLAASAFKFVLGRKASEDDNENLAVTVYDLKTGLSKDFMTSVKAGLQRAEILGDRVLILQAFTGQPLQRSGELHLFDLCSADPSRTVRVVDGLHYSGPLNQRLLTLVSDTSFLVLRRNRVGRKALALATLELDKELLSEQH